MTDDPLAPFHPRVAAWFRGNVGTPTDVQVSAWPRIAAGEHVLATAPTGSGKTLCAFLHPLDRLLTGAWSLGTVRVVYVSPLKALNNDIRRNLVEPLAGLRQAWTDASEAAPEVAVATRSGDTPPEERRRMARRPPEILITTPESLNILLTSTSGRGLFDGVRMVILDEIHAVAGSRRGVLLMSAVEALTELAGEFQRVSLSATVRPLETVARLVGGHAPGPDGSPMARPRPVRCVGSEQRKELDIGVRALEPDPLPDEGGLDAIGPIARAVVEATRRNRSTLVFTNSRALCEKLAWRVNEAAGELVAWAHHGSLSREIRLDVESRLKAGELKAIVATSSLELGIDIGSLDEVIMVQTPPAVAATIQRAGRAGHGVGERSKAVIHPTHPQDILEAVVAARAAMAREIEPTRVPQNCLDVLAQVLVAAVIAEPRYPDALFDAVRRATPYRWLPRAQFDLVIAMLTGRYADSRVRDLRPRLLPDPATGLLHPARGASQALYASGGVIPDRGYFQLRHGETQARIGELDEEFVWETAPGRAFSLGSQQWRVQRITHNDVFVTPAPEAQHAPPFWRAEERDREPHFGDRMRAFLSECEASLAVADIDAPAQLLPANTPADAATAAALVDHLRRQRAHTNAPLPHDGHLLVERVRSAPGGYGRDGGQLVIHDLAGGRVNRCWGLALEAAWMERFGEAPETFASNDALVVQLAAEIEPEEVLELVSAATVERYLRARLEDSGFFAARFRECAGRALLLTRSRFGERLPLWLSRLQAQKLLGRVRRYGDFPIVLEAWRTTLEESLDVAGLQALLARLETGELAVTHIDTAVPSPFAAASTWRQINRYMYQLDEPSAGGPALAPSLVETVVADRGLRPQLAPDTVAAFDARRRRLEPGWAPKDMLELQDWLRERRFLEAEELRALLTASGEALAGAEHADWLRWLERGGQHGGQRGGRQWVVHRLDVPVAAALFPTAWPPADGGADPKPAPVDEETRLTWVRDFIAFRPPATVAAHAGHWPGAAADLAAALATLEDEGLVIRGHLVEGAEAEQVCDAEAFEAMLRRQRATRRGSLGGEILPEDRVPVFLAGWHRLGEAEDVLDAVEGLRGLPVAPERWEADLLPARLGRPAGPELDAALARGEIVFYGAGERRLALAAADELDHLPRPRTGAEDDTVTQAFPDPGARYPFERLREACGDDPVAAAEALWGAVWAGRVTAATFEPVRAGLARRFTLPSADGDTAPGRRGIASETSVRPPRRSGGRGALRSRIRARVSGYPGDFFRLAPPPLPGDAVERLERDRERARLLLDRWGVVSPSLLAREQAGLRWRDVSRALRLMELAGEVVGGLFLTGLDGPQFATTEALRLIASLGHADADPTPRWLAARDPASPCGLGLATRGLALPARRAGCELVLRGPEVAMVVERSGRSLRLLPAPEDSAPVLAAFAGSFAWRHVPGGIRVEHINGEPARTSPYVEPLRAHLEVIGDHRHLTLTRPLGREGA